MGVVCGLNLCPRFFVCLFVFSFVCLFVCVVAFLCLGYSSGFVRFGQRFLVYSIEGAKIRCAEFLRKYRYLYIVCFEQKKSKILDVQYSTFISVLRTLSVYLVINSRFIGRSCLKVHTSDHE